MNDAGTHDAGARPHRGRRRVIVALSVTVVVALVLVVLFGWWWRARGPDHPSVDSAVDRFQAGTSAPSSSSGPEPGVYVYAGRGDERLSFLSTKQSQDGNLPGTVTSRGDGCFDFTIEYNSFHRQSWSRCVEGATLVERANTTDQKFDFGPLSEEEHATITCAPATVFDASSAPGSRTPVRCTGFSKTTDATQHQRGHVTFVGRASVRVGGAQVPALHFRQQVRISGDQHGTSREDMWFAAGSWLPLRERRSISVVSPAPAPLNEVTYTEEGQWLLTASTPRS